MLTENLALLDLITQPCFYSTNQTRVRVAPTAKQKCSARKPTTAHESKSTMLKIESARLRYVIVHLGAVYLTLQIMEQLWNVMIIFPISRAN